MFDLESKAIDIHLSVFKNMEKLPEHKVLCKGLLQYFCQIDEVSGAFVSGSGAAGGMDNYSDLDLGFICNDNRAREKVWKKRWDWSLPPWFHRMDADHVKPYFIIYLFEPHIHVDLAFYTPDDLPPQAGGPFKLAFDKANLFGDWLSKVNEPFQVKPDWSNVVHEEERFWTWTHYSWCHTGRGEYYDDASTFGIMRGILQKWHARLNGTELFDTRRLEQRGENAFIESMIPCFPKPNRAEMKKALLNLIEIHNQQRQQVEDLISPKWTTTPNAREKITQLIRGL